MAANIPPPPRESQEAQDFSPLLPPAMRSGRRRGRGALRSKGDTLAAIVAVLGLLVIVVFTWTLILTHKPKSLGLFAYHPTIQTVAVTFFALGILSLQRTTLDDPAGKKKGLIRHQYWILLLAIPLITTGVTLIYDHKDIIKKPHLATWHGIIGLATYCVLLLQAVVGACSVWFGGAVFGGGDKAKRIYKYHRILGYTIFTLLLVTVHLGGAWSDWVVGQTTKVESALIYTVMPACVFLGVAWRVRPSKMNIW